MRLICPSVVVVLTRTGNLLTAVGPTGTITTTYDRLNGLLTVSVSTDSGAATSFTYGLTSATRTDRPGSCTAALDWFGRHVSLADPIHGSTPFTWTYRAGGQLASAIV